MIVVARHRPDLQRYFEEAFAGIPDVMVIRDRRIGELAAVNQPEGSEPREGPDRYSELRERGFIIVRVREPGSR